MDNISPFTQLVESILILIALILCVFWLKHQGILSARHQSIFSRLVTDFTLPALIFLNLSQYRLHASNLLASAVMIFVTLICFAIGGVVGKWLLKLNKAQLGAFILICGLGSSSSLGYAIVAQIYPSSVPAMVDAMVISEFGAVIPLFTIGIIIASYYGKHGAADNEKTYLSHVISALKIFLKSPMFISIVLGIAASFFPIPFGHIAVQTFYKMLKIIGGSLEIFIVFGIGLMLHKIPFKKLIPIIIAMVAIKLIIEPAAAFVAVNWFSIPVLTKHVLVLEAGMPAGAIAALIAARYGCDGPLGANLCIATYVVSLITLPVVFLLFAT